MRSLWTTASLFMLLTSVLSPAVADEDWDDHARQHYKNQKDGIEQHYGHHEDALDDWYDTAKDRLEAARDAALRHAPKHRHDEIRRSYREEEKALKRTHEHREKALERWEDHQRDLAKARYKSAKEAARYGGTFYPYVQPYYSTVPVLPGCEHHPVRPNWEYLPMPNGTRAGREF
ncbi:MAG: hypothetical protein HUU20_16170 [Pirellulales bacterium]|nr:hypothetical protein [Pirellulales bacterium]